MKKILVSATLWLGVVSAFAQGTVTFFPTPSTLSSVNTGTGNVLTSGAAGSYYYGLLTSATPTGPYIFTGNYATNLAVPGYFGSLSAQTVNGWAPGATMSFEVVMWSSSLGHDFQPSWLTIPPLSPGYFGVSQAATGVAGGLGTPATPPLPLFGSTTISQGIIANAAPLDFPEPNIIALSCAGITTLVVFCRRR